MLPSFPIRHTRAVHGYGTGLSLPEGQRVRKGAGNHTGLDGALEKTLNYLEKNSGCDNLDMIIKHLASKGMIDLDKKNQTAQITSKV